MSKISIIFYIGLLGLSSCSKSKHRKNFKWILESVESHIKEQIPPKENLDFNAYANKLSSLEKEVTKILLRQETIQLKINLLRHPTLEEATVRSNTINRQIASLQHYLFTYSTVTKNTNFKERKEEIIAFEQKINIIHNVQTKMIQFLDEALKLEYGPTDNR